MLEILHSNQIVGPDSNSCCVIHNNKDVLHDNNQFMIFYILHKGNYCEDFMVKLVASSDRDLLVHSSPPSVLGGTLAIDTVETFLLI